MASSSGAGFTFAAASVASTNTISPLLFGWTGSPFSFSSPAVNGTSSSAAPSPIFGNPNPFSNNFRMTMEDSMEEDNTQAAVASTNPFGFASQPAPSGYMYNSSATRFQSAAVAPTANSFQFASQQSLNTSSPSQASSSLGSFSFGAGGGDKSTRKMIKVRKGNWKRSGRGGSASFAFGGVSQISAFFGRSCSVVPSSSVANSRGAAITSCSFSWQQPSTSPTSTAALSTSMTPSSGAGFTCGATSVASTNSTSPLVFGSMGSPFSLSSPVVNSTSSSAAPSPIFGKLNPFGNNYQMSMEDSMAEDNTQAVVASTNPFGYASRPAPSGFMYNSSSSSSAPPTANSFQFAKQFASQLSLNTPSPFQASCSLGSFSLGNSGGNKSIRRMIKVRKGNRKK